MLPSSFSSGPVPADRVERDPPLPRRRQGRGGGRHPRRRRQRQGQDQEGRQRQARPGELPFAELVREEEETRTCKQEHRTFFETGGINNEL